MSLYGGQFDSRVTIEEKSVTQDTTYGTEVISWVTFASEVPAEISDISPKRSAESVIQGIAIETRMTAIKMRWIPGIDSSMRVIIHGEPDRTCQIVAGPAMIGRRQGIELMVTEYSS